MKKTLRLLSLLAVAAMIFALCSCSPDPEESTTAPTGSADVADEDVTDVARVDFNVESLREGEGKEWAVITAYDDAGEELWNYESEKGNIGQLEGFQEIGLTSYGYLFNAEGTIYCLGIKGDDSGKVIWTNDEFEGESISFAFDEEETLYIAGYFGPHLMIVSKEGKTLSRFDNFGEDNYWVESLELLEDGNVVISFEGTETILTVNPEDGSVISVVSYPEAAEDGGFAG